MISITITAIICGTFAYLGYLGHKEWEEEHHYEKPKPRQFLSIDEVFNKPNQPKQQEYKAE